MRVVLVGPAAERARLRGALGDDIEVVGEAPTLPAARGLDCDAFLIAATTGVASESSTEEPVAPSHRREPERAATGTRVPGRVDEWLTEQTDAANHRRERERAATGARGWGPAHDVINETLTPREIQVLELLAEGLPNKAIAARLDISDQTVKFHVSSICAKLGASNRTAAVRRAVRRGLITL